MAPLVRIRILPLGHATPTHVDIVANNRDVASAALPVRVVGRGGIALGRANPARVGRDAR